MRGLRGCILLLGLALGLAPILTVAGQQGATLPDGVLYVPEDNLTIDAGESVTIGPATKVYGVGQVHVWGTLTVKGASNATANFTVPIVVFPGGRVDMEHAHVWTIDKTAIEARGAQVSFRDVLFEGNDRAILAAGASRVVIANSTFREHAGEAIYVEERANISIDRTLFAGNGRGLTLYSAARFHLNDSDFAGNGQHLVVDLGPWSATGDIVLSGNRFAPPAATPAQLPAILLRHDPPLVDESAQRTVRLESNRIEGAPVGLRAEGRGLVLVSRNDTLVDNAVGLSVQLATVRVEGGTFGNDRDVEGSGRVTLEDVTYLRGQGSVAVQPPDAPAAVSRLPWLVGGGVALLALGGVILLRRTRAPGGVPPPAQPPAAPDDVDEPMPPRAAPAPRPPAVAVGSLTSAERRILEDILAHPGTAQRAVADRLGTTRQALHYHVKKLEARGLVVKSVEGRETRCTVPPAVANALVATAVTRTGSEEKA